MPRNAIVVIIFLILIGGGVLAYTDFSKGVEERSFSHGPESIFRPFFQRGLEERDRGVAGKVYEINGEYLVIETPHGQQRLSLEKIKENHDFKKGDFIISVGERIGDIFFAQRIKILDQEKLPMINRGIHRRFDLSIRPPALPDLDENERQCLRECINKDGFPPDCLHQCVAPKNI